MQIKIFNRPIPGGAQINEEGNASLRALPLVAFTRHADSLTFRKNVLLKTGIA